MRALFNRKLQPNPGKDFETLVTDILDKYNVSYQHELKIYDASKNLKAEIDILLRLGETLYIIECKTHATEHNFNSHYELYSELTHDHIPQILNAENIFRNQFNELKIKYPELLSDLTTFTIKKVILHSTRLGEALYYKDCFILDIGSFVDIFENKPYTYPDHRQNPYATFFGSQLSLEERMKKRLANPRPIEAIREYITMQKYKTELFGFNMTLPQPIKEIPNILYAEK
jgi:hypothetical protein